MRTLIELNSSDGAAINNDKVASCRAPTGMADLDIWNHVRQEPQIFISRAQKQEVRNLHDVSQMNKELISTDSPVINLFTIRIDT